MRIALIYWGTSSVGGIATHATMLMHELLRQGHEAHILFCPNQKSKQPEIYAEPLSIRGGDTRITVDGQCSHHPERFDQTKVWLEQNYDALYFTFLCPHQTKAYPNPIFMPMFLEVNLPKAASITDAYWDSYSEWAIPILPTLRKIFVVNPAYAKPILELGYKNIVSSRAPFMPYVLPNTPERSVEPLLIFPCQWKAIKGVKKVLQAIPTLAPDIKVELYSCGIEYYQLRYEDAIWNPAINKDHFDGWHGKGRADYFGNLPYDDFIQAYHRAWWSINLQGHASKYKAYLQGGYNYTEVEALYYGAMPILHRNTLKSDIPHELYETVDDWYDVEECLASTRKQALDPERQKAAKEWVLKVHSAEKIVDEILECLR